MLHISERPREPLRIRPLVGELRSRMNDKVIFQSHPSLRLQVANRMARLYLFRMRLSQQLEGQLLP